MRLIRFSDDDSSFFWVIFSNNLEVLCRSLEGFWRRTWRRNVSHRLSSMNAVSWDLFWEKASNLYSYYVSNKCNFWKIVGIRFERQVLDFVWDKHKQYLYGRFPWSHLSERDGWPRRRSALRMGRSISVQFGNKIEREFKASSRSVLEISIRRSSADWSEPRVWCLTVDRAVCFSLASGSRMHSL
jgi:hypothetical protein